MIRKVNVSGNDIHILYTLCIITRKQNNFSMFINTEFKHINQI